MPIMASGILVGRGMGLCIVNEGVDVTIKVRVVDVIYKCKVRLDVVSDYQPIDVPLFFQPSEMEAPLRGTGFCPHEQRSNV